MAKPPKGSKKTKKDSLVAEPEVLPKEAAAEDAEVESDTPEAVVAEIDGAIEVLPPDDLEIEAEVITPKELKKQTSIARYDPLSAYLREIQKYAHLTPEEEKALAIKYQSNKDVEAAYRLVSSNLWLVVKIARDYERAARNILDLIQEGNIGLMEAVKNFDPYRGVRFPSYAVWWIKAYIIRFVMANWRMVKIGTTQAQRKLFFNLKKEKDRLEKEGFFATSKLLAERLQVKESDIVEMEQRLGGSDVSVDAPIQTDSDTNLLSMLPIEGASAEELIAEKEARELIARGFKEFASTLKANELIIFESRLLAEEKATLQDLSEKLSLSRERVRQIEQRVKEKLKDFLIENYGSTIEGLEF